MTDADNGGVSIRFDLFPGGWIVLGVDAADRLEHRPCLRRAVSSPGGRWQACGSVPVFCRLGRHHHRRVCRSGALARAIRTESKPRCHRCVGFVRRRRSRAGNRPRGDLGRRRASADLLRRSGLGAHVFETLQAAPESVFRDPALAGAPILVALDNFGCGSSREHAVWALADFGIRAVIARVPTMPRRAYRR